MTQKPLPKKFTRRAAISLGGAALSAPFLVGNVNAAPRGGNTTAAGRSDWNPIDKIGESVVTSNMQIEPKPIMQGASHTHDQIATFNGWQYAAFYTDAGEAVRHVSVARRRLPNGQWEVAELPDYQQTEQDRHNIVNMGVSTKDGTIHLAFDHHTDDLHYRRSVPGLVTDPTTFTWDKSLFGPLQNLDGQATELVTYPSFFTTPQGTLMFAYREGRHANLNFPANRWRLWEYRAAKTGAAHHWNQLGLFLDGEDPESPPQLDGRRRPYPNGFSYDSRGRLHMTWTWRILFNANTNHDVMYAYSDNNGRTWRRNDGRLAGVTGQAPITRATPEIDIQDIPSGRYLLNTEGQTVDAAGRVHAVMRDDLAGFVQWVHNVRDTDGTWHRNETGLQPTAGGEVDPRAPRCKVATDKAGNVFAVVGRLQILGANAATGYKNWQVVEDSESTRFEGEPLIDKYRLAYDGVLSVSYQELNSRRLIVQDYAFNS